MSAARSELPGTIVVLLLCALAISYWTVHSRGVRIERARWRAFMCAHGNAVALDTLCVRPDSTWRVAEPKEAVP